MPLEPLYSVDEAARRLGGISPWTVHAWLSKGRLQRTKVGGRTMIRESELLKMIRDGEKSPGPGSRARGTEDPGGVAPVQQIEAGEPHTNVLDRRTRAGKASK